MQRIVTLAFALLVLTLVGGATAEAQTWTSPGRRINAHERRQIYRIRDGWRDGELTRLEGKRLLVEQAQIRAAERIYRRTGGGIGPREALDLRRDLRQSSRQIYRQKHDGQTRSI
jgi:hypothetical protein